jgi:hypothetical protein
MPARQGMPPMPMPMMSPGAMLQLQATGQTTNLLGYTCQEFQIKRHGETMEIWATDQLWPFQGYQFTQPRRVGPPMIEERWSDLLVTRKLFPLLAELKLDNGAERYHFEVQSIKPSRLTEKDTEKFQVPADYIQIMARPF